MGHVGHVGHEQTCLPPLVFDGPAWAGTRIDYAFGDSDRTFELNGGTVGFEPTAFDPCEALGVCLDGADLGDIIHLGSDELDMAGLTKAVGWLRRIAVDFDDSMTVETPGFTGTAADILEGRARPK